jgi:adenylate cyclase
MTENNFTHNPATGTLSHNQEPVANRNSRENLDRLLAEILEYPERRQAITKSIEEMFGQEKAVMVLDMSGFSQTTQRFGITSFLLMIHQMRRIAEPCVIEHKGLVLKAEADNLFCLFDSVKDAVLASQSITRHLTAANQVLPHDHRLYVSIGIGWGKVLNIADQDLYGNEVNLAAKLGEDIAGMGEILLTVAAHELLREPDIVTRQESVSISGLELTYFEVENTSPAFPPLGSHS